MRSSGRARMLLGLALVATAGLPRCACDEDPGIRRANFEMRLTFLEEDSCSANVIQRRIPDDYMAGLSPSTDFGSRGERRFEIRAIGEAPLTVSDIALSTDDPEFSIELTDADGMPVTLPTNLAPTFSSAVPPGIVVTVRYAAADAEPDLVELVVMSDDPAREEVRFGLAARRGKLEVCVDATCGAAAAVDFGSVSRGTSASQTVTLRNTGEGELDLRSIRLVSDSGEFCAPTATELPDGLTECNLIPQCLVLRPGETYEVEIGYSPVDGEEDTGELVIVSGDASAGNVIVPINGRGAGPGLCVCEVDSAGMCNNTGLVDFGFADVGASVERTVPPRLLRHRACRHHRGHARDGHGQPLRDGPRVQHRPPRS